MVKQSESLIPTLAMLTLATTVSFFIPQLSSKKSPSKNSVRIYFHYLNYKFNPSYILLVNYSNFTRWFVIILVT